VSATEPGFLADETHVSGRRLIAHWIDGFLIAVITVVLVFFFVPTRDGHVAFVFGGYLVSLAYFVGLQRRDGRTPGKRLCGLRVVDVSGRTPDSAALVKRTVPLFFEWFGLLAWMGIISSRYRQRWGDRWARTYVVES
jgi:uncharacterized RDD family membrane protein YckC